MTPSSAAGTTGRPGRRDRAIRRFIRPPQGVSSPSSSGAASGVADGQAATDACDGHREPHRRCLHRHAHGRRRQQILPATAAPTFSRPRRQRQPGRRAGNDQLFGGDGNDVAHRVAPAATCSAAATRWKRSSTWRARRRNAAAPRTPTLMLGILGRPGRHDRVRLRRGPRGDAAAAAGWILSRPHPADGLQRRQRPCRQQPFRHQLGRRVVQHVGGFTGTADLRARQHGDRRAVVPTRTATNVGTADDVKIATFDVTSSLAGITNHDLLLV